MVFVKIAPYFYGAMQREAGLARPDPDSYRDGMLLLFSNISNNSLFRYNFSFPTFTDCKIPFSSSAIR